MCGVDEIESGGPMFQQQCIKKTSGNFGRMAPDHLGALIMPHYKRIQLLAPSLWKYYFPAFNLSRMAALLLSIDAP